MPQIEEIGAYLKGVWLLILGDRSGFDWLDITVTGVWRSFAAFLWCLPAMAVGWAAWRLFYLEQMPTGTETGLGFILKLFLVDMTMWIVPLVLVAVLAKPLGYGDMLASIIISTNWLAVPTVYAMAVPLAIRLVIPGGQGLAYLMSLILLLVNFTVIFRLVKTVTNNQLLLASAISALLILPSLMLSEALPPLLGLMPVYPAPL
ncbi:hypothetical protein [Rhizobium sp. Root483D2]|jgi:hypothetical protein|uniref:hypothetical protein n=1 Tax=Rhizobium sp. Root483D2 TaxID=1736545 RepID=UPI0007126877|nr:hypothetical protein [Rhizobium sp. Root483D2]KQY40770.1 hypothetical protein ASD32_04075 [Rhizobium sp. Root483D2]